MSTRAKIAAATASAGVLMIGWRIGVQPAGGSVTTTTTGTRSSGTSATSGTTATTTAPSTSAAPPAGASAGAATSTTAGATAGRYADGTFIGTITSNEFGQWQVTATISGGRITEVQAATSAQDKHSTNINSQAVPILRDAVLAAQSADVNLVSGATLTSQSYLTSLQAALDQAAAK